MSSQRKTTRARVRVVLDVALSSTWAENCPVGQVHDQALREARLHVEQVLGNVPGVRVAEVASVDVVTRVEPAP